MSVQRDDRGLIDDLRQIYRDDVRRAERDLTDHGRPVVANKPRSSWGYSVGVLAAAVVLVAGLAALSRWPAQLNGPGAGVSSSATGKVGTAQNPTSGPIDPTPTLVDGLPTDLGGVPVLRGQAAISAIEAARVGQSLLVGGWHFGGDIFCTAFRSWWMSCYQVRLQETAAGGTSVFLYLGPKSPDAPSLAPNLGEDQKQPMVVQVHTHDASCPPDIAICTTRPVIDQVVWRGAVQAAPSVLFGPAPSGGLSESDAVSAARKEAETQSSGPVTLVLAEAGPYGHVGPTGDDVAADHWVWAVVFSGEFPASACSGSSCQSVDRALVVVDYIDGNVLIDELYGRSAPA
jgi:hypothetical protein